jgi:hypothetical protein
MPGLTGNFFELNDCGFRYIVCLEIKIDIVQFDSLLLTLEIILKNIKWKKRGSVISFSSFFDLRAECCLPFTLRLGFYRSRQPRLLSSKTFPGFT